MIIELKAQALEVPSAIVFELAPETFPGSGFPSVYSGVGTVAGVADQPVSLLVEVPNNSTAWFVRAKLQIPNQPDSDYAIPSTQTLTGPISQTNYYQPKTNTVFNPVYSAAGAVVQLLVSGTAVSYLFADPGSGVDSPAGAPPAPNIPTIYSGHVTHTLEIKNYVKPADFRFFEWQYSHGTGAWAGLASGTSTSLVHTRLNPTLNYAYRVRAVDQAGNLSSFATTATVPVAANSVVGPEGMVIAEEIAAGSITAGKISVANLAAITADLGIISAGRIDNAAVNPTAGILFAGGYPIPATWTQGIFFAGANPPSGGITSYLDFTATGTNSFLKHPSLNLKADGTAVFSGTVTAGSISAGTATITTETINGILSLTGFVDPLQFTNGGGPLWIDPSSPADNKKWNIITGFKSLICGMKDDAGVGNPTVWIAEREGSVVRDFAVYSPLLLASRNSPFGTDSIYDIGSGIAVFPFAVLSGEGRPRDFYLGRDAFIGRNLTVSNNVLVSGAVTNLRGQQSATLIGGVGVISSGVASSATLPSMIGGITVQPGYLKDGSILKIGAWGFTASNANAKTVQFRINGANLVALALTVSVVDSWNFEIELSRTTATTMYYKIITYHAIGNGSNAPVYLLSQSNLAQTVNNLDTSSNRFDIAVTTATAASDVTLTGFSARIETNS